jgi:hypothetical protein
VPLVSADYINIPSNHKFYFKNGSHAELPSSPDVRNFIIGILNGNSVLTDNLSNNSDFCDFKGKRLTWHSPVTVDIYDSFGNHSGPTNDSGLENNVPGVDYEIINGEKFIFIPTDSGQNYTVKGTGEKESTFDLLISDISNGTVNQTVAYKEVPIIQGSQIQFNIDSTANTQIQLAYAGDNKFTSLQPSLVSDKDMSEIPGTVKGTHIDLSPVIGKFDTKIFLDSADKRTVWLIGDNEKKFGFTSEEPFRRLGYKFQALQVSDMSQFELGELITESTLAHPDGSLIKADGHIWLISNNKRFMFDSYAFDEKYVMIANSYDLNIPKVEALTNN